MSIALPTPPPGSPFRAEYDEQGRVRLSWRARFDWKNDLIVLAVLLAFSAYLVFFARGIMGPAAACVVAVVLGAWKVYTFLRRLNADQLILGDSVLRYDYEDHSKLGRQVREIPRAEVGPIRLESVPEGPRQRPRPRLTLDRGADRLVIRRVSRECDLEWLAGVLRAWAGGEQRLAPPARIGPPPGSSIVLERDADGVLCMRWQPGSRMLALAQWGQTAQLLLGIGVLVTTLIGMTGFLLLPALRLCLGGGGGVVGWVTVGFLCVVVCVLINSSCWPMRELLLGLCPPATYATTGPNAEGRSVRETLVRSGILALARLVETVQTFVGLVLMLAMLCGVAVPLILLIRLARAGGLTPGGLAVAAILLILGLLLVRACCSSVRELLRLLRAVGREPTPGKGADDLTARCGVLRASAEERLTLTPRALRHEPGLYLDGRNLHCGLPQEVPRSEIGAIRLEWNDTRPRPTFEPSQRLLVEQGGGQFEIGPNLRDPEREWLADVLRAWAAVPIPAGPADQGEDGGEAVAAGRGG